MAQWLTETPSCRKLVLTSSVTALVLTSAVTVFTGTIPALAAATPATTTPGGADASAHAGRDARPRRVGVEPRKDRQGHNRSLLCRTCKLLPLVCATLRRLSCPSGGPIEHQRASEGSAGAARPCRRAAPRLSPVGGPNPSPHSGRLQVSSESTPPSVRVATGPAGHRGRDQALSPAGPSPRSTQTMRWPGLSSARGPPTRPIDASSHQGPFKADRLLPDDVHRQPAARATGASASAPRSCPSLALVTASRRYRLSVPQVRIRLIRQQVPSARRLFAAAAPASRRRSVASRGGAVGVLAGRRRFAAVCGASSAAARPGVCSRPSLPFTACRRSPVSPPLTQLDRQSQPAAAGAGAPWQGQGH